MATNADAQIRVTADVSSATQGLKELEQAVSSVNNAVSAFHSGKGSYSNAFSDMTKGLSSAVKEYENAMKSMSSLARQQNQIYGGSSTSGASATRNLNTYIQRLSEANRQQLKNIQTQRQLDNIAARLNQRQISNIQMLTSEEQRYQSALARREGIYNASSKAFNSNITQYEQALASQQKLENSLASREQVSTNGFIRRIGNSAAYIAGYGVFNTITTGLTSGLAAIRDYKLGVTDLRRTLEQGDLTFSQFESRLSNFGKAAVDDAKTFGVAITDAQEAMTELARAGVDAGNLESMTESVLMGLNTTELETASEVTSALVSTIKQMGMEWSDSSMILDSWNMLADRYAVQTDDFAHAIERSGAASKMLGMDLYDLNAVVTILGESTQASGEQVGTAFRSLSARLLRDSTINKLAEYGIQVKDTNGTFLEFGQIMKNINDVIKDLPEDSIVLSDIMDTLGGAWRKNWITALAQDFDRFDDLVQEQAESIGYSAIENEKAMDTIAKKAETLKQTFLEAFIDIGEAGGEDAIKDLLDGTATALESAINSPTLRKAANFLFGNPLEALGVAGGAMMLSKLTTGLNPLQAIASVVNSKVSKSDSTLAGWMNQWYDSTGVSGKQNRAEKLYNSLKKTYNLTDTEMIPVAGRIDDIFKSSTASIAKTGSEVERLKAQLADVESYSKSLFTKEGRQSFMDGMQLSTGVVYDKKNTSQMKSYQKALQREQQRSLDVVVQTKQQLSQMENVQKRLQQTSTQTAERGIFNTLTSSGLKEGIRGFVGGLASGALQMVAIGAAAKGIDWLLHRNENAHNDFNDVLTTYQEMSSTIDSAQDLANSLDSGELGLISSKGENLGLDESVFASLKSQLEQLKSIDPDIASAIERSARQMGNYGDAANEATRALAAFEQKEASTFVSENAKQYQKDMRAWTEELRDVGSYQTQAINEIKKKDGNVDFFKDLGISSNGETLTFKDENNYLDNIEALFDHQQEVSDKLENAGKSQEWINAYFDDLNAQRDIIRSAISSAQEFGMSEFKAHLYGTADEVAEAVGGIEHYDNMVNELRNVIGEAQSVPQAQALEEFVNNMARDEESVKAFSDIVKDFGDISKIGIGKVADRLQGFAEDMESKGFIEDGSTLMDALFRDYFDFDAADYQGMIANTTRRIEDLGVDLQKALNVDNLTDLNTKQFAGFNDFMNELQYKMNVNEEAATAMVDALNEGIFAGADFSKLNIDGLAQLSGSQMTSTIDMIKQMQSGAEGLGSTLQSVFGSDITTAFNQLTNVAASGAEGFSGAVKQITQSIDDVGTQASVINELADAFDITLNNDMLKDLGFKIEVDDSGTPWLSQILNDDTTKKTLQLDAEYEIEEPELPDAPKPEEPVKYDSEVEDPETPEAPTPEDDVEYDSTVKDPETPEAPTPNDEVEYPSKVEDAEAPPAPEPEDEVEYPSKIKAPDFSGSGGIASLLNPDPIEVDVQPDTSQVQEEIASAGEGTTIKPKLEFDFGSTASIMSETMDTLTGGLGLEDIEINANVKTNSDQVQSELQGLSDQEVTVNVKANVEEAKAQIQSLLNSEDTAKLNVQANTSQAESEIQSLLSSEETAKLTVQADTSQARSEIQSLMTSDSTAQLRVQADTAQAESQINSLSNTETVRINVEADTGRAQSEIDSLGGYGSSVDVQVNADTSQARYEIESLGSSAGRVEVPVDADTSRAISQIQAIRSAVPDIRVNVTANVAPLQASLASIRSQAAGIRSSLNGAAASAASAGASITALNAQVQMAIAAVAQLRAAFAAPITINIDMGQLQMLAPTISAAGAAASAAMAQIQASIQATAAAFSAGCAQMVSAWASMSFPAPHIPMPTISVSAGVGTYSASISWHAAGGIIPATPGGRIVGVAEGGEDEAIIPISKLKDYIKSSMSESLGEIGDAFASSMERTWNSFARDLNTFTSNGYYATKVRTPYVELDADSKAILNKFVEAKPLDLENFDIEKIDQVIKNITYQTDYLDKMIEDADDMVEFYEAYGDSINQARAEVERFNYQWQQIAAIQQDANELMQQANAIQKQAGVDLSQYIDMNYEVLDALEDTGEESESVLDKQIEAYAQVIQKVDELKDKLHELNVQMLSDINDLATDFLEASIEKSYESQKKEIEDRLELIEDERDAYLDDLEEQRDRLESAKDDFEDNIDLRDKELQDRIDAIRDEQDRREDEAKLKDLQDKIKDAQDRLDGLTNEYNTKVYTMDEEGRWQFTYEADPEELEDAQKDLEDAQNDLKEFYEDQEIERLEKEQELLQEQLDNYNKQYDDMMDALDKQQEAREEAWDDETEALQDHLDELNEMQEYAMDHIGEMAKKLIDYLMSVMGGDMSKVYDYLQVANGNYGGESYNPLGGTFMTEYAKQIAATGQNLEELTNKLLEITRNPTMYDPNQVLNAKNELDKLGTTGAIDLSERIEITPQLAQVLGNSIGYGLNEYIYSLLSRIGTIRTGDSGTGDPQRGEGYVVTAEHVADYLNKLGLDVSATMVKALSESLNAYDYIGSVGDVMQNIFNGLAINEDGTFTKKDFDSLLGISDEYLNTTTDIYDIAGAIGMSVDDQLANSEKLISQIGLTQQELQAIAAGNANYTDVLTRHITELTGKMDANTYFSSEDVEKSEELIKAMGDTTDVNQFILEELRKIGTIQKEGDKAGQEYTKDDAFSYLESLGISEELIMNTVTTTLLLQETQQSANLAIQDNTTEITANTKSVDDLERTNTFLDRTVSRNTSSIYGLDDTIDDLIDKLEEYTESINAAVASAAASAESAKRSAEAAAAAAAAAASAASSSVSKSLSTAADMVNNAWGNSYSEGGVISYTGGAEVHGSKSASEVVFNAADAKKLYDLVHNNDSLLSTLDPADFEIDLTQLNLPLIDKISPYDVQTQNIDNKKVMNIENITMEFPQVNDPDGVKNAILNLSRDIKLYA